MIPQGKSAIEISPTKVGYGPVRLHAEQKLANGQTVRSLPVSGCRGTLVKPEWTDA